MVTYINIKSCWGVETIDEFKTYKEGRAMLKEYSLSDSYNKYYLSQRCTKDWRVKI
jgi:hypothetical protein